MSVRVACPLDSATPWAIASNRESEVDLQYKRQNMRERALKEINR
jgi:hypothetical protein